MKKFLIVIGIVIFFLVGIAILPAITFAQPPYPGIHVKILDIRNSTGTVVCALFDSKVGFPIEVLLSARNVMITKVLNKEARFTFEDIPPGTYAIVIIHDENMNGKLDTKWLGIPKEGYGFSNDVRAKLRTPSFSAASFYYDGENIEMTIKLNY